MLVGCGQISSRAQLFLVAQRPGTNSTPDLVALGWNPSPDTNATGYFLCWGLASGTCTNRLGAGNATNATVAGLATSAKYYFSVVAYGAEGRESPPSNIIAYSLPPTLSIWPSNGGSAPRLALSFPGNAGAVYSLQATLDFTNWATLFTTNCAAAGPVVFQVTDPANYPRRFYRLALQ